jgi:inorganic pyrophosphatase
MSDLIRPDELPAIDDETGRVNVVIETPRNSRCKYKFDVDRGIFRLDKLLPLGADFPYAFGFIPSTEGDDGDPLDVLVILEESFFTGCAAQVRLIGVLEAEQTANGKTIRNDRLLGAIETAKNPAEVSTVDELSPIRLKEIEHFFQSYNEAEGRQFRPLGRSGPDRARQLVEEGRRRHDSSGQRSKGDGRQSAPSPSNDPQQTAGNKQEIGQPPEAGRQPNAECQAQATKQKKKDGAKGGKPFGLRKDETFRKGIRRIVRHQYDKAIEECEKLQSPGNQGRSAVHEIRKRFKRVRAVLRLVRSEVEDHAYRRENAAIRDAGQTLSNVRNAKVVLDALGLLKEQSPDASSDRFSVVEHFLRSRQWDLQDQLLQDSEKLDAFKQSIDDARKRVKNWTLPRGGRRAIRRGLKQACNKVRRALEDAESTPTDERLHEFRKQAKYFYHQLQLAGPIAPAAIDDLSHDVHELERALGDDHDLAMLRREAVACVKGGLDDGAQDLILAIDRRRREIQRQSIHQGHKILQKTANEAMRQLADRSKESLSVV